jgi:hypothetical protein
LLAYLPADGVHLLLVVLRRPGAHPPLHLYNIDKEKDEFVFTPCLYLLGCHACLLTQVGARVCLLARCLPDCAARLNPIRAAANLAGQHAQEWRQLKHVPRPKAVLHSSVHRMPEEERQKLARDRAERGEALLPVPQNMV